eukprot:comp22796_c1_seq1/m.35727 comp22796_c1_seq1/g.35727  ORF comp22796_c1_seq1/g.35727 comp22796_c1_seq1/m.35727 type:complete len:416 (-) comp22796_c1_seq1:115-1362(-)
MEPAEKDYFDAYSRDLPLKVTYMGEGRGKGVVSTREISEGEVVFKEKPLVAIQHVANRSKAIVCDQCFRFIGTLQLQVDNLLGEGHVQLPPLDGINPQESFCPIYQCANGCGALYCSELCRNLSYDNHHRLLCPGEDDDHPWWHLYRFALETNDIFLLVTRGISTVIQECERNGGDVDDAEECFRYVFKAPWWDVVGQSEDGNQADYLQSFHTLVDDATDLLRKLLPSRPPYDKLLDRDYISCMVGMYELNNAHLSVSSPVNNYLHRAQDMPEGSNRGASMEIELLLDSLRILADEEAAERDDTADKGKPAVGKGKEAADEDEEDPIFIACEGNGLYRLQACLNHSCRPNVALLKGEDDQDGSVVVRALRHIQPGEELCISYIEESEPLAARRQALREYLFDCRCEKCVEEEQQQ